ncbi:MAG TPA: DUF2911 domain-containing protein [Opitutaceae bacterium]|nr:DUF2911 domain-containing protein [Opitutaceae bacterium]
MNASLLARFVLAASFVVASVSAQSAGPKIDFPAPSPLGSIKQRVGLTDIEIEYYRPGVKGRKVFGGLEPYGVVWRTGANNPTKIKFSTAVKFGGKEVPAGSYGLYSIPGEKEWTVIINKIGEKDWGAYAYKAENDVARAVVKPVTLAQSVETFTIDISDVQTESATLNLSWDKTRVPVKLQVDVMSQMVPQIEALMNSSAEKKPYFQAAMFYFENGGDLKKAVEWMDAGLKENPAAYYMVYRKGLVLAKMGDKAGALAAAKASREAADKDTARASLRAEYLRLNDALIARLK